MSRRGAFLTRFLSLFSAFLIMSASAERICASDITYDIPLKADSITASSVLSDWNGIRYSTSCLQDSDASTAWVEGVDGPGTGESLCFYYKPGTILYGGMILPGYQKSEELFFKNAAPSLIEIRIDDVPYTVELQREANTFYGNEGGGVRFSFNPAVMLLNGTVTATIREVRPGSHYEDTCISEFLFYGGSDEQNALTQGGDASSEEKTEQMIPSLTHFSSWVFKNRMDYESYTETTILAADMTASQQAAMLYWYQYNMTDSRITHVKYVNAAKESDLQDILAGLFADALHPDAMSYFLQNYVEYTEDGLLYMNGTGDFGDAGLYYFGEAEDQRTDGDILTISGPVMSWNRNMECYIHENNYTASFRTGGDSKAFPYSFVSVTVGF